MPTSNQPPDEDLIHAANAGDEHAFAALYDRHRDWVVRLAFRFTGSRDDALDVLQETFIYVLKKIPGLRLTAGMRTFLYPVVKHISLNLVRKRKRMIVDSDRLPDRPAPTDDDPAAQRAELAVVVGQLPEAQREVLLMRFADGLALAEIAEALQIPLGTVKSRLHKALRTLAQSPATAEYFRP